MNKSRMKQGEYVMRAGTRCPYCQEESAEHSCKFAEDNEAPGERVKRRAWCISCGEEWQEVYVLKGWNP